MLRQIIHPYGFRFIKYLAGFSMLVFTACSAVHDPPPHAPVANEDMITLEPSYTAYTNGISCKQVGQLLIMETGRDNLGLMIGSFITGVNYQKKRVSSATIGQLLASVNLYCTSHPNESVTKAMIALDHDIDDGFASSSSVVEQSKPSKQNYRNKTKRKIYKALPDTGQYQEQTTTVKSSVKPTVKRKTVVLPKSDPDGTHVVQVMSSQVVDEAQKLAGKLKSKGFPSFVTTVNLGSNGTWHRVLIGPYKDNISAGRVAELLEKYNYKAFVRQR